MSIKVGILGLPNVGKSTLFNALTSSSNAESSNYPFCTIDPNVGVVDVPDQRLQKLSECIMSNHPNVIPAIVEFVDIAGLVKGASQGEGLGNKFLANIRECQILVHVVRCFEDTNIHHVNGNINPCNDKEIIESELMLADMQTIENRIQRSRKQAKTDKAVAAEVELLEKLLDSLNKEIAIRNVDLDEKEQEILKSLHLLSAKKIIYVANINETKVTESNENELKDLLKLSPEEIIIPLCIDFEQQISELDDEESEMLLSEYNLSMPGLNLLIQKAFDVLGLQTYFTAGEKEVRAWTIKQGSLAPQAAGVIHTDFERGFIKADVIAYNDYIEAGTEQKAKEMGKLRQEGKEYIVKDGDVIHFKFNV